MATALLSPHFDDAILSCWHRLEAPEPVTVINVFAGAPRYSDALGWWDRATGALDSPSRVRERAREDRSALALAGRVPVNLDLLDAQYRRVEVSAPAIVEQIAPTVTACDAVYAPAALGDHPDHALVRAAALHLHMSGARVLLYADLPHAIANGWPTWVSARDGNPTVDAHWRAALSACAVGSRACVHALERSMRERKLAALRAYRTQIAALEAMAFAPLERSLRYEVVWELAPA
jgi:LmbE family N-acetylglucosaminyl deacetylase